MFVVLFDDVEGKLVFLFVLLQHRLHKVVIVYMCPLGSYYQDSLANYSRHIVHNDDLEELEAGLMRL